MRVHIHDVHNCVLRAAEQVTRGGLRGRSFVRATFEMVQASSDFHIFIADGAGSRARRQALYSGYKAKRPPLTEDRRAGIDLFKTILTMSKALSITCPGWEADDVIGTVARQMALSEGITEVRLHTNDSDFGQLADFPGIVLPRVKAEAYPAAFVPLFKALCGDTTDEIPGLPGFGKASFEELRPYWPQLKEALGTNDHLLFLANIPWKRGGHLVGKPEVFAGLCAFFEIVHLFNVPNADIEAGSTLGSNNPAAAAEIFERFML